MGRRESVAALAAGAVALVSVGAVQAAGSANGIDASTMVLAPTDVPGATVVSGKAQPANTLIDGAYARVLKFAKPYGASRFLTYESTATVVHTADFAKLTYTLLAAAYKSKSGQASLAKEAAATGKGVTVSGLKSHAIPLGDSAQELDMVVHVAKPKRTLAADVIVFRVDRVISLDIALGTAAAPQSRDAVALASLVLAHIKAALAPALQTVPTITGTAQQGQLLAASPGTWSGTPTSYAYQWQHCDATGANCTDIPGATAFTYNVTSADVGTTLRVNVTATNADSSASASSAVTAVVQ